MAIGTLPGTLPKMDAVAIVDNLLMGRKHFTPPRQPKHMLIGGLGNPPTLVTESVFTSPLNITSSVGKIFK